jgi:hypothetical protein
VDDADGVGLAVHPESVAAGARIRQRLRGVREFLPRLGRGIGIEARFFEVIDAVVERVGARVEREAEDAAIAVGAGLERHGNKGLPEALGINAVGDVEGRVEVDEARQSELAVDHVRQVVAFGVGGQLREDVGVRHLFDLDLDVRVLLLELDDHLLEDITRRLLKRVMGHEPEGDRAVLQHRGRGDDRPLRTSEPNTGRGTRDGTGAQQLSTCDRSVGHHGVLLSASVPCGKTHEGHDGALRSAARRISGRGHYMAGTTERQQSPRGAHPIG